MNSNPFWGAKPLLLSNRQAINYQKSKALRVMTLLANNQ